MKTEYCSPGRGNAPRCPGLVGEGAEFVRGSWVGSRMAAGRIEERGEPCRRGRGSGCGSYEGVKGGVAIEKFGRRMIEDEGGSMVVCDKVDEKMELRRDFVRRRVR